MPPPASNPTTCRTCMQTLPYYEFPLNRSTLRRAEECGACRCLRLAKRHRKEAEKHRKMAQQYDAEAARLFRVRKRRDREYQERIVAARAAAGRD